MDIDINECYNSLTEKALQTYTTASEFPCTPKEITNTPLKDYYNNLEKGNLFSKNKYYSAVIDKVEINERENSILILCISTDSKSENCFSIFEVTFKSNYFIHKYWTRHWNKESIEKIFDYLLGKIELDDSDPDFLEFEYL